MKMFPKGNIGEFVKADFVLLSFIVFYIKCFQKETSVNPQMFFVCSVRFF